MTAKRDKVVVAMSGGVDSSVAACLLVEQGYDVLGLFMRSGVKEPDPSAGKPTPHDTRAADCRPRGGREGESVSPTAGRLHSLKPAGQHVPAPRHQGCCSTTDAADARYVAGMLRIPFYVLNFEQEFDRLIDYFADEYAGGRTPNPCILCNDWLKFGRLVDYADAVGAKYVATGHYARVGVHDRSASGAPPRAKARGPGRRNVLMRARDARKDQSYVLFSLHRDLLDRVMFPVGALTKREVRRTADRFRLPNRDKPDSVEICFVPDRDYARVVRDRRPEAFAPGEVRNEAGEVIGRHQGIAHYTIGQRRGLGIAAGRPIYVTRVDPVKNTVTMGDGEALLRNELTASRVNFLVDPPAARFRAEVKIRYLHQPAPATVEVLSGGARTGPRPSGRRLVNPSFHGTDGKVRIVFDEPQRAITPGQGVVFYDGDVVLGGAWIDEAPPSTAAGEPSVHGLPEVCSP